MPLSVEFIQDKAAWGKVLEVFRAYDFVHTHDFHSISESNGEGTPLLLAVKQDNGRYVACWPALRRLIPGSPWFDVTSVYGYGGPLVVDQEHAESSLNLIFEAMRSLGVVAVFSRMHPLFVNDLPDAQLRGTQLSDVVVIDLEVQKEPLLGYRSGHRQEINKALRNGVQIDIDYRGDHLDKFVEIYQQSMVDLEASHYYLFSKEYFGAFKKAADFKTIIIFAMLDGKPIAASMFIVTGKIMQYYLSGTVHAFKKLSPSKAIIAKAHELALGLGVEKIILGGGVGSQQDALFNFKKGFSDLTMPFYIFKKVLNLEAYHELCSEKAIDPVITSYFPAYRMTQ